MRTLVAFVVTMLVLAAITGVPGQQPAVPAEASPPPPGSRGNADNVPYIGKSDPRGNPIRLAKATGHVSNYSEEKVAPYTLPDPLVLQNGQPVTSAEIWWKQRRPEILRFYETEIYGRVPAGAPRVRWQVSETDPQAR